MSPTLDTDGQFEAPDEIDLTSQLVALDTSAGGEERALDLLAEPLSAAGFEVSRHPDPAAGDNLVARWGGGGRLVLSGHVDTVPFDASRWRVDPLGAEVVDGRLYGRGSSDMKGGVAAMLCAAVDAARAGARGFTLAFTSGEERGCLGARVLAASGLLPTDPILVVGESTGNRVMLGHKGVTWIEATATGVAAHSARPELGINAIELLALAISDLVDFDHGTEHGNLGGRTVSVGTIAGGLQTNLVPDHAVMSVDVRTVPGAGAAKVGALLLACLGQGSVEKVLELPAVWTQEGAVLTEAVLSAVRSVTGSATPPSGVSYFTDAAVLGVSPRSATYIVGPGDPDQPHTVDESCSVESIRRARQVYAALLKRWDDGALDDEPGSP